ncbi:hypothetical protein ALE3EI_0208 [Constantimarinum furrinae]|uniref:Curlin associated repeat-containing protein n=2 Tax=Constantimarinum furrinae TaxID=2562285 RepID=A0A7G8PR32_9FLAO|nr:hypothetical protein ALE3EI_0208 [Constantimarinum furrinae]
MKFIFKYGVIILMLATTVSLAQTYTSSGSTSGIKNIESAAAQQTFIASQASTSTNITNSSLNNAIYIEQVGNYNSSIANTISDKSRIQLFQRGNNNEIQLNIASKNIFENVYQLGYNNSFLDLSLTGNAFHTATVIQRGTNQNLIWTGTNSISDSMLITMQGKKQTVFVRNFKR